MHLVAGDRGHVDHRALAPPPVRRFSPRASTTEAKKLTWNTWPQVRRSVSSVFSRAPPSPFGRDPGIVDQRVQPPAQPAADLLDRRDRVLGIGQVDLDVILRAAAPGAFVGKGWREQVITRQPSALNRRTVAWPIPRLAPVRSIVSGLRSWSFLAAAT